MEWSHIWRTVFVGWDGDVDLTALAEELRHGVHTKPRPAKDRDAASNWVCEQIQEAY